MAETEVIEFDKLAPRVEQILRNLLGSNTAIDLSPGFEGRVRVKVISPKLNNLTQGEKGHVVWDALNNELKEDARSISYVVAYSTDEL